MFRPNDDARIGETEAALGLVVGSIWACLPLLSFFFADELSLPFGLEGVEEEEVVLREVRLLWGSVLSDDLMPFFLSDLLGELKREDRGLLDPSGLEESDFLEEKNRPLNTIFLEPKLGRVLLDWIWERPTSALLVGGLTSEVGEEENNS